MKNIREAGKAALTVALAAGCIATAIACSEEKKAPPTSTATAGSSPAAKAVAAGARPEVKVDGTLLSQIPKESFGFFQIRFDHPAYKKLKDSPWGGTGNDISTLFQGNVEGLNKIKEVFTKVGLDPLDKKTWENLLNEAVVFAAPGRDGKKVPGLGIAFTSQDSDKVQKLLTAAKAQFAAEGNPPKDVAYAKGTGYSIAVTEPQAGGPSEVFVGWSGNMAVVGSEKWVAERVLSGTSEKPEILGSPTFAKLSGSFAPESQRFATLFVELGRVVKDIQASAPAEAQAQLKDLPLEGFALSMSMDQVPLTTAKLAFDQARASSGKGGEILSSFGSSTSAEVVNVLPSKPLFFVSLDGQSVRKFVKLALASAGPEAQMFEQQLAFVDDLKRIAIGARVAPLGQSLLPVPDVLVVAEVTSPDRMKAQVEQVAGLAMQSAGMGDSPWTTETIENVSVKGMSSPIGAGVYMASSSNLVMVSSSKPAMKAMLSSAATKAGFSKELSSSTADVFSKSNTFGNVYINFDQVASFMENMGGMMAMMGGGSPEGNPAAEYMKPENIAAMRKMGIVFGSVKVEPGVISVESSYQPSAG